MTSDEIKKERGDYYKLGYEYGYKTVLMMLSAKGATEIDEIKREYLFSIIDQLYESYNKYPLIKKLERENNETI